MTNKLTLKTAIGTALMGSALLAGSPTAFATESPSSTCELDPNDPPYNFYFGDLHIHTVRSLDSYLYNNANTPEDAYRFAKGEKPLPIGDSGVNVKITRPLDFAAVTDHAESMAEYHLCVEDKSSTVFDTDSCQKIRDRDDMLYPYVIREMEIPEPTRNEEVCPVDESEESVLCRNASMTMWNEYKRVANEHNQPGEFTTFIAYEYSPTFITDGAFHRNVIFKGTDVPDNVLSVYDVYTPSELWSSLMNTCVNNQEISCDVMTIPHNPNQSKGMFFALADPKLGQEYTPDDYNNRSELEQLIEIYQSKGNSECFLGVGTADEFCQFESIRLPCDDFENVPGSANVNCLKDS